MVCREVYLKMFAGGDSIFNREVAGNTSERLGWQKGWFCDPQKTMPRFVGFDGKDFLFHGEHA